MVFKNQSDGFRGEEGSGFVEFSDAPEAKLDSLRKLIEQNVFTSASLQPFSALDITGGLKNFVSISKRGFNPTIKLAQQFYEKRGVAFPSRPTDQEMLVDEGLAELGYFLRAEDGVYGIAHGCLLKIKGYGLWEKIS